jgi:hypothetical protein
MAESPAYWASEVAQRLAPGRALSGGSVGAAGVVSVIFVSSEETNITK